VLDALWHFSVQDVIGLLACAWRDEMESVPVPELQPAAISTTTPIII
jgi:hypothetical protein